MEGGVDGIMTGGDHQNGGGSLKEGIQLRPPV